MVSVTNPLMDSEIWGANLTGKCVVCRSDKAVALHPTMGRYICLMRRWLNCTPNVGHNLTSEGAVYETFI